MVNWETLQNGIRLEGYDLYRAKVPGGWLIYIDRVEHSGLTFLPDPNHEWDGNSLP
jgi:hypothetical protein